MKKNQKLANITEIILKEKPTKGDITTLTVKGYLSDPSWKLKQETISFEEETKTVRIRIFVEKEPKSFVMQVIKDFEQDIKLTFLQGGKWVIHCNSINTEVEVAY